MQKDVSNILKDIDSIDTCCLEASYNVSNAFLEYEDKTNIITEYFETSELDTSLDVEYAALEQCFVEFEKQCVIQEGVGEAIKSFFSKALEVIKRFFAFIGRQIAKVFNFLFRRNAKATPDQIADEMGLNTNHKSNATTYNPNADVAEIPKKPEKNKQESVTVDFPASADSAIPATKIKLMVKDVVAKIKDGKYVIGPPEGFAGDIEKHGKRDGKYGVQMGITYMRNQQINLCLAYVKNRDGYRVLLNNLIKTIITTSKQHPNGIPNDVVADIVDQVNNFVRESDKQAAQGWKYDVDQALIMHFQKDANDVIRDLSKIDTVAENESPKYASAIKQVLNVLSHLTMGCNQLGNDLAHMYMIDAKYLHSISDIDTLGKFVSAMIEANIPTKQVAYNTWCAMSENFDNRGFFKYEKGYDFRPPRWGQTRVVFFPTDAANEVIKVAMNQAGILGNKREFRIYDIYKKYNKSNILAKPIKKYGNYSLITMEKLDCPENGYEVGAISLTNTIRQFVRDHQGVPLIDDIHAKNVGKDEDGNYKIIDYAG